MAGGVNGCRRRGDAGLWLLGRFTTRVDRQLPADPLPHGVSRENPGARAVRRDQQSSRVLGYCSKFCVRYNHNFECVLNIECVRWTLAATLRNPGFEPQGAGRERVVMTSAVSHRRGGPGNRKRPHIRPVRFPHEGKKRHTDGGGGRTPSEARRYPILWHSSPAVHQRRLRP